MRMVCKALIHSHSSGEGAGLIHSHTTSKASKSMSGGAVLLTNTHLSRGLNLSCVQTRQDKVALRLLGIISPSNAKPVAKASAHVDPTPTRSAAFDVSNLIVVPAKLPAASSQPLL